MVRGNCFELAVALSPWMTVNRISQSHVAFSIEANPVTRTSSPPIPEATAARSNN
jgi:hypothetical protein